MRNIDFTATLNVVDEEGTVTGTRELRIVGRVYAREATEDNPSLWQLHDYRAYAADAVVGESEPEVIYGVDGDAIKQQAEAFAAANPETAEQ